MPAQLFPFILAGISQSAYILKVKEYPYQTRTILESQHNETMVAIATQYQTRLTTCEQHLWSLYQRSPLLIQEDSTLSHEEKTAATEELQIHERPIVSMGETLKSLIRLFFTYSRNFRFIFGESMVSIFEK